MICAIFGTGGFGREIMPIMYAWHSRISKNPTGTVFVEDHPSLETVNGFPVVATERFLLLDGEKHVAVAIGDPGGRMQVAKRLFAGAAIPLNVVSSIATIYEPSEIGEGAIVCAYASIHPNTKIGRHFHANIYSYIAHDCVIGDFVTFAPRVNCNGNIHIGEGAYIGTGAMLRNGEPGGPPLRIGAGAIVGMGAVVTKDVPPGAVVAGNPARILKWKPGYGPDKQL